MHKDTTNVVHNEIRVEHTGGTPLTRFPYNQFLFYTFTMTPTKILDIRTAKNCGLRRSKAIPGIQNTGPLHGNGTL